MPLPKPVILLVEDDHLILLHATLVLEDAGYEVLAVPDAEAARATMLQRHDIAALLTDVDLAGGCGIELARQIHAARPDVSIVVTSGKHELDEAALPEGGRFMPKPYTDADVRRVLAG